MKYTASGFIWRVRVLKRLGFTKDQRRQAFHYLVKEKWEASND